MLSMNDIMNVSDSFIHLEEFVDRATETNQFQTLVDKRYEERDAHKRIIAFYGPPGIGKTMLLDRLEFECVRMKVPYTRISFEVGIYNNTIEILREMVRELDPAGFKDWNQLDRYWFSSELDMPELNIHVKGQEGGFNFQGANLNAGRDLVSGDMVAGSKVEIKNNTFNLSTRAALDPMGAQIALTESFVKALGEFVQQRPAVILLEGLDHEYCSAKTRVWVDGLLDRIRVLKGFGVLPIVTYFNAPNYEAKLRSVTLRAELKPLNLEHIAEYFRARRIPENIIADAAKSCIEETRGVPARVYEYTENIVSALQEQIAATLVQSVVTEVQERLEQAEQAGQSEQEVQTQPVETAVEIAMPDPLQESVESLQETISADETNAEASSMMEQKPGDGSELPVTEVQSFEEIQASELPGQADEMQDTAVPQEKIREADSGNAEADRVLPEGTELAYEAELPAQEDSLIEGLKTDSAVEVPSEEVPVENAEISLQARSQELIQPRYAAEEEKIDSEINQPAQETPPAEVEARSEVPFEAGTAEGRAEPELDSQTFGEGEAASTADALPQTVSADVAAPIQAEASKSQEMPSPNELTADEEKRSEEAFRRSQERLKQLKSEGKSSTANMVDSLLGRQSEDVADVARRCAVLRWFTVDLIGAITDQGLNQERAAEVLSVISSWPFVQNFGYGTYSYRREVRQYLQTQLHNENLELFREIHRRAQFYFEKQLGSVNTDDEMIWINLTTEQITALRENLYYLLHVDVHRGFHLLGQLFQSAQRLYMPGEAAILLKFAEEVDKSTLSQKHINLMSYYEAALEFAEGDAASAENKLRALLGEPLDDEIKAQVLGQLGVICAAAGKYDEAIHFFEQAQRTWQKLKRERERAKLSNNLGNVYMRKNDLNRAERSFNDALNGLKKAGTPSESALALNNLGNVYLQKENLSKALEHYQKSLQIKTSIGDQFGAANTHSNLGTVYQRMAQESSGKKQAELRQQAASFFTRSYEAYRMFGARSNQGKQLFKLAYLYYQSGDKVKAREYLPDALEIFRELEMAELENASKLEKQLG